MNTNRDLLKRLIHLYPIKIIKESFQEKGNLKDILESVTGSKTAGAIKSFACDNQHYTKQNIYLFTLNKNFNRATFVPGDFPLTIEKESVSNGEYSFFCLPKVTFSVYLSNPTEKLDLQFLQPALIKVKNKSLILQYTKLEANVKFHFPLNREAKKNTEQNGEEITLKNILSFFGQDYAITVTDINKGVKHLWHIDNLDCHKVSYRNPHSTTTTLMDGVLTFKDKYPAEYQDIIKRPIGSAIWIYLLKDDYLCEGFTADLSGGFISITKFPKLPNQVNNVISKILTNN